MSDLLFDLLVDKTKPEAEEIQRLAKFRGLDFAVEDKDIHSFLDKYFSKDSIDNKTRFYEAHFEKWAKSFAAKPLWGIKIDPLYLEPFIARYVNAINAIGAKTLSSCDGWHDAKKEHGPHILFKDRYSRIWHKIMCERLTGKRAKWTLFEGNVMDLYVPKTDEGKIKAYITLNKNAEQFERQKDQLLNLKAKVILKAKDKKKSALSDEEVEEWLINLISDIENNS